MRMFNWGYRQSAITQVKASGQIGDSQFVIFEDGAVVVETPKRVHRFNNLQELVSQAKSHCSDNNTLALERRDRQSIPCFE